MEPRKNPRRGESPWWRRARRPAVLPAAAAVTLLVGAGGAVAASTGGSGTVLNGCYAKDSEALRLLKAGQHCKSSEIAVSWNQTGPAGPQGLTGPAGPKGATGPAGPPGVSGYVMNETQVNVPPNTVETEDLLCPTNNEVLTGGA